MKRGWMRMGTLAALTLAVLGGAGAGRAAAPEPTMQFNATGAAPRVVEEATAQAVQRDYQAAWRALETALEENRGELLAENFTGQARDQWTKTVEEQQRNGLSRRVIDRGHQVRVTFYSQDGSALEVRDVAELETEYRDGNKVLASRRERAEFVVLLTPAENSWKIRILQQVPGGQSGN